MAKRTKRRHDTDDAPIDGDYTVDVILNKDPAKHYMLANDEDAERFRGFGAVFTERREDGPRPAFDLGADEGSRIRVRGLWLMEMPTEVRNRITSGEQRRASERSKALDRQSRHSGGVVNRDSRT